MLDIHYEWLNDFVVKMKNVNWKEAINTAIKKSIYTLEREAKIQTPVDTGILRNSYTTEFSDLVGRLINFREYGIYVHEWWKFYKWNPFLTRTMENTMDEIETIFSKEYDALLEKLA